MSRLAIRAARNLEKNGRYKNLIDGSMVEVMHGYVSLPGDSVIIRVS